MIKTRSVYVSRPENALVPPIIYAQHHAINNHRQSLRPGRQCRHRSNHPRPVSHVQSGDPGRIQDVRQIRLEQRAGEHAPIALDAAGIEAVVAEFYARIFFRNAVNGGYLVPFELTERLCDKICTGDELTIDVQNSTLHNLTTNEEWRLKPLGEVAPIIEAGGVFEYARKVGMLKV